LKTKNTRRHGKRFTFELYHSVKRREVSGAFLAVQEIGRVRDVMGKGWAATDSGISSRTGPPLKLFFEWKVRK